MPANDQVKSFTSPIIEPVVGPDRHSFHAHTAILSKSNKLKAMLEGKWKNSIEFKIVLTDWDPETIAGLLSWMYTADYDWPKPQKSAEKSDIKALEKLFDGKVIPTTTTPAKEYRHPFFTQWCEERSMAADNQTKSYLSPLEDLHYGSDRIFPSPLFSFEFDLWSKEPVGPRCYFNYEPTLLTHAKPYALANYMLLPSPHDLAYKNIKAMLLFMGSHRPHNTDGLEPC